MKPFWRVLYVVVGALLIAYAVYAHETLAGLWLLVFVVLGVLLLLRGLAARRA